MYVRGGVCVRQQQLEYERGVAKEEGKLFKLINIWGQSTVERREGSGRKVEQNNVAPIERFLSHFYAIESNGREVQRNIFLVGHTI